jgi:hypothetical protein
LKAHHKSHHAVAVAVAVHTDGDEEVDDLHENDTTSCEQ